MRYTNAGACYILCNIIKIRFSLTLLFYDLSWIVEERNWNWNFIRFRLRYSIAMAVVVLGVPRWNCYSRNQNHWSLIDRNLSTSTSTVAKDRKYNRQFYYTCTLYNASFCPLFCVTRVQLHESRFRPFLFILGNSFSCAYIMSTTQARLKFQPVFCTFQTT